ncbi:MAG: hypothetical protein ACLQQB_10455 [Solirubrobacteraceae bacterium]
MRELREAGQDRELMAAVMSRLECAYSPLATGQLPNIQRATAWRRRVADPARPRVSPTIGLGRIG